MGFLSSDRLKVACALAMIAYMYSSLNNLVTGKKISLVRLIGLRIWDTLYIKQLGYAVGGISKCPVIFFVVRECN